MYTNVCVCACRLLCAFCKARAPKNHNKFYSAVENELNIFRLVVTSAARGVLNIHADKYRYVYIIYVFVCCGSYAASDCL